MSYLHQVLHVPVFNKRNVFKHKLIEFELNERKRVNNSDTSRCFLSKSSSGKAKLFAF